MDLEDFELAVTTIILLLQRLGKRWFKRKIRKQWVSALVKEREKRGANYQHIDEMRLNDREFSFKKVFISFSQL